MQNLTNWCLQLPVAAGSGVQQVCAPQLHTYTSAYFFSAPDGAMQFFTPLNGAHTSGSSFPRSELREELNFGVGVGVHNLSVTTTVLGTASGTSVTIGQLHIDGVQGSCSIGVELEWQANGDIVSHLRDKKCGSVKQTVGSGKGVGDAISFFIAVDGDTVTVVTDSGAGTPYSYSWFDSSTVWYYKAGNYLQGSGSSSAGSNVAISSLVTTHA